MNSLELSIRLKQHLHLAWSLQTKRNKHINITDYKSLLAAAKEQVEPQRLLFVFLKTSLPKDYNSEEETRFLSGEGGELEPVMCVDKTLDELGDFSDLVKESESMEQNWQIVLVACLSGKNGIAPSSDEAVKPLEMMVNAVKTGGNLSNFLAFEKNGTPIQFGN